MSGRTKSLLLALLLILLFPVFTYFTARAYYDTTGLVIGLVVAVVILVLAVVLGPSAPAPAPRATSARVYDRR